MTTGPKRKKTPLTNGHLAHFRETLLQLRTNVELELEREHEEVEVEREQRYDDVPPVSTDTVERLELNLIEAIDAALARIEEGMYGLCVKTGKRIPLERLEAIPYADMTVEVEREAESSEAAR